TNAGGSTRIDGGVTTSGAQTYNDALTLNGNTTLTSTAAGNISLTKTVDGTLSFALTVNTAGTTTLGGAVGATTALGSLATDAGGMTNVSGGSVSTIGD